MKTWLHQVTHGYYKKRSILALLVLYFGKIFLFAAFYHFCFQDGFRYSFIKSSKDYAEFMRHTKSKIESEFAGPFFDKESFFKQLSEFWASNKNSLANMQMYQEDFSVIESVKSSDDLSFEFTVYRLEITQDENLLGAIKVSFKLKPTSKAIESSKNIKVVRPRSGDIYLDYKCERKSLTIGVDIESVDYDCNLYFDPSWFSEDKENGESLYVASLYAFLSFDKVGKLATPEIGLAAASYWRMVYFSASTSTTLGFGDILPETDSARGMVILQSFLGLLIMGLLIWAITIAPKSSNKIRIEVRDGRLTRIKLNRFINASSAPKEPPSSE